MSDIVAIGEAMIELSCDGEMQTSNHFTRSYGGDTFNASVAMARLGSSVTYVSRFGQDAFASGLQGMLATEGIFTPSNHRPSKENTGLYFVSVDRQGQRRFAYYRQHSAARLLSPDDIKAELIQKAKIVYSSGITLAISDSARQATMKAFQIAREAGVMTALDPNYRKNLWASEADYVEAVQEILPFVDVFLPSFAEDTEPFVSFRQPEQVVEFFRLKDVKLVVAKAEADGCYLGYKKQIQHIPTTVVTAVDTTGAGDAFTGGFLHGLATGQSLERCAKLGNATAALKVITRGSAMAMPKRDAVYQRLSAGSGALTHS